MEEATAVKENLLMRRIRTLTWNMRPRENFKVVLELMHQPPKKRRKRMGTNKEDAQACEGGKYGWIQFIK